MQILTWPPEATVCNPSPTHPATSSCWTTHRLFKDTVEPAPKAVTFGERARNSGALGELEVISSRHGSTVDHCISCTAKFADNSKINAAKDALCTKDVITFSEGYVKER